MNHFDRDTLTALQAKQEAQRIAFAPFVFQASRALRDFGLLRQLQEAGDAGLCLEDLQSRVGLSRYAVRVLVEAGLGIGLVIQRDGRLLLTKLGWYMQNDAMTRHLMESGIDPETITRTDQP